MKNIKYMQRLLGLAALALALFACEPQMDDAIEVGAPPTESQVDFDIASGGDDFTFVLKNKSSVVGITHWDLGDGTKTSTTQPSFKVSLPEVRTITLTLVTKSGYISKSKKLTQTKTDYSLFNKPEFVALSGGSTSTTGKTWVLDAATRGHIGVGSSDGNGNGLEWWAAGPYEKAGTGLYDDEINFKLVGFAATYNNKGVSYVKEYRAKDAALSAFYKNGRANNGDWDVDYTPQPGTWMINERGGKKYLKLAGATPIFPCFDVGAKDNEYEIVSITDNLLELTCYSSYESWTKWHYFLVPKK